ncbi:MAG TPA: ABC transporter permease [Candidatus Dormibacteraeota bacterium]|nr:ABC transporter permease [Candidatus Dormibacteraeota bacterium]
MQIEQWFYSLPLRLRSFFHPNQMDQELKEELREHLEEQIRENVARGMSQEQARRSALLAMGGITQIEQRCRDARGGSLLRNFTQDLRYGFRQLGRNKGFSALAILCLTLGIGANAAVFSWVEGILFRPYPLVEHQERLFAVAATVQGESSPDVLSWPDFLDLRRNCTLCEDSFVSTIRGSTLNIGDHAEVTTGSIVSANYFDAIGVHPILGRGFEAGEDVGNDAHPVVVISYPMWRNRFKGDAQIIGKTQRLNNVPHTIIGVAPEGFYGTFVGRAIQFWVPVSMEETFDKGGYKLEDRGARWIESYVRLKPGVSRAQAQQQISAIATQLQKDYPATNRGRSIGLWALWQTPFNHAGELLPILEVMVAVVAFVLLIACANVGNLLLVRSFVRRQEMSVRLAIGASRGRLLQQLLTEGLILAVSGTAGGFLMAYCCRQLLTVLPVRKGDALYLPGAIDGRVMAMGAGICLLVALITGLVPAMQTNHLDVAGALKAESGGVVGIRSRRWIRSGLVIFQVCLSFILLVGAALLLESLQKVRSTNPGFSTTSVAVTGVSVVAAGYDVPRAKTFQNELIDRLSGLPGIESAAFAAVTPLGYAGYSSSPIAVDSYQPAPDEQPEVEYNQVGPGYLATMGIPLLSGREFARSDDENAALVAIVNRAMVMRYWRGQDPIGHRLQVKGRWLRVVGVAADSKYESMSETSKPFFYVPLRQDFVRNPDLNIRTTQSLQSTLAAVLGEVHALDQNLALYEMITLQEQVDRATSPQLVAVTLVSTLGGLALLLAAVGLYGVMSYAVAQSTRELGLRMALGADAANLRRLVISRGLRLTAGGILFGVVAALALTRLMGQLLYKVSPHDPVVFGLALAVMTATAMVACLLPAWRASRTDPARVLRD